MQKVSVFVDVQNIFYTTKQKYGCNFNYNTFWNRVVAGRELVKATAYAIDRGDEKQKKFQNILRGIGFEVKLKPFISRKDGSSKGDWDVGITIDIMECAQASDLVVLASGDGDFDLLVQNIRTRHNTASEVCGVRELTANSLINSASKFFPIEGGLILK